MDLPAWTSRMNAACFAATLDFEDALVATIGQSLGRKRVLPDGCAFSGCVYYGKSTSIRRSLSSRLWIFLFEASIPIAGRGHRIGTADP